MDRETYFARKASMADEVKETSVPICGLGRESPPLHSAVTR
jgi:hypothetical protein